MSGVTRRLEIVQRLLWCAVVGLSRPKLRREWKEYTALSLVGRRYCRRWWKVAWNYSALYAPRFATRLYGGRQLNGAEGATGFATERADGLAMNGDQNRGCFEGNISAELCENEKEEEE